MPTKLPRTAKEPGEPNISGEVIERIKTLANKRPKWTGVQIHEEILRRAKDPKTRKQWEGLRLPRSDRSTQRYVREARIEAKSAPWNVLETPPGDVKTILAVLADVRIYSDGQRTTLSKAEASAVVRIQRGAPGLHALDAYWFARQYLSREVKEQTTDDLDNLLALAAIWSSGISEQEARRTWRAYQQQWPEAALAFLIAAWDHRDIHSSPKVGLGSKGEYLPIDYDPSSLFKERGVISFIPDLPSEEEIAKAEATARTGQGRAAHSEKRENVVRVQRGGDAFDQAAAGWQLREDTAEEEAESHGEE